MSKRNEVQILRILYLLVLLAIFIIFASPFIIPIVLAGSLALTLFPLQARLERRGWKKTRAALLITTIFTFMISIPFLAFSAKGTMILMTQLKKFEGVQATLGKMKSNVFRNILTWLDSTPFSNMISSQKLDQYLKSASSYGLEFLQGMLASIPTMSLFLIVMILCVFSFLHHGESVKRFFQDIFGFSNRRMDELVMIMIRDSRQVYISNVVTGVIQSSIISTAASIIVGVDWFLVFFVTLILSFIPVIGAAPMGILFAIVSFFQGNIPGGVILLVISGFTGVVDNILRPWLTSLGKTNAPQMVSFVCILGGALLLGFPGLFLGLLVASIVYDTFPIFWEGITKQDGVFSQIFSLGSPSTKNSDDEMTKH